MATVAKRLFFDIPSMGRVHSTGGSIKFAGDQASKETSDLGSAGDSHEFIHGELKFKVKNRKEISGLALQRLSNVDVTVTDDAGKTWQCSSCTTTENVTLSDGEYDMTMMFDDQQEVS